MSNKRPWVRGLVHILVSLAMTCFVFFTPSVLLAQSIPDSLTLQKPDNITAWRTYNASRNQFVVYVKWDDPPDSLSAIIHPPDTTGWHRMGNSRIIRWSHSHERGSGRTVPRGFAV